MSDTPKPYPPAPHLQRSESIVDVDALQAELTRLRNERARIKVYSAVRDAQTHQDLAHMLCLIHHMEREDA